MLVWYYSFVPQVFFLFSTLVFHLLKTNFLFCMRIQLVFHCQKSILIIIITIINIIITEKKSYHFNIVLFFPSNQGIKFSFTKGSTEDLSRKGNYSPPKKAHSKNAKRIKNASDSTNHYRLAKLSSGECKAWQVRTSILNDETSSLEFIKDKRQIDTKENSQSVKRSERIKIKREKLVMEDQFSDTSSISDVSSISSDVAKKKTPLSTNKPIFRSKRLNKLQERVENVEMGDDSYLNNNNLGDLNKGVTVEEVSERTISCLSQDLSHKVDRISINSEDEQQSNQVPGKEKKRKLSSKNAAMTRVQVLKKEGELPSSSEDEESNKPLSELKKEIKKPNKETAERVVKKVIKVVRKVKTKNGETKMKVVKIIKKVAVRKKTACEVVTGRRRIRCGQCKGCKVVDDCGTCRWCKYV